MLHIVTHVRLLYLDDIEMSDGGDRSNVSDRPLPLVSCARPGVVDKDPARNIHMSDGNAVESGPDHATDGDPSGSGGSQTGDGDLTTSMSSVTSSSMQSSSGQDDFEDMGGGEEGAEEGEGGLSSGELSDLQKVI